MNSRAREDGLPTAVYVTLVHGTWAHGIFRRRPIPGIPWYAPEARFSQSLKTMLEKRGLHCEFLPPCIWSGGNSISARRQCVKAILKSQVSAARAHPNDMRILIAHSHGGNAAIRAFDRLRTHRKPHGLVTMSTPFIVTERRQLSAPEHWLLGAASWIWQCTAVLFSMAVSIALFRQLLPQDYVSDYERTVTAIVAALAITVAMVLFRIFAKLGKYRSQLVRKALQETYTSVDGSRLFAVRAPGDEASLALAMGDAVQLANAIARRVFELPIRIARAMGSSRRLGSLGEILFWSFFCSVGILSLAALLQNLVEVPFVVLEMVIFVAMWLSLAIAIIVAVAVGIAVLLGLTATVSILVSSLCSIGYGPEYLTLGWAVRTTAESSPLGVSALSHSLRMRTKSGLRHGIYRSWKTRRLIAAWIVGLVEKRCGP